MRFKELKRIIKGVRSGYRAAGFLFIIPFGFLFSANHLREKVFALISPLFLWPCSAVVFAGVTVWSVAALPIAVVVDGVTELLDRRRGTAIDPSEPTAEDFENSSTHEIMLQFEADKEQTSKRQTAISNKSYPSWVDACSSAYFKGYIQAQSQKPKLSDRIKSLGALSAEETEKLRAFEDPITLDYIDVPVELNEHIYDVNTIATLENQDPFTRLEFNDDNVMPSRRTLEKFDAVFDEIVKKRNQKPQVLLVSEPVAVMRVL